MIVPLLDLKKQYQEIRSEIDDALRRVVESQYFILGPEVEKLEEECARYLGCRHTLAVSSGTDALLLALMALDIRPGDEVIVPDYSFFATAGVVSRLQARPVFCDIDPVTFNLDPGDMKRKITSRTRAVIPVHLYGQSAAMDEILRIAAGRGVTVIEDAAQAIGASYRDGRRLGTLGRAGCFSFFPSKNLGCFGDGGMITTDDPELFEKMHILRVHGSKPKYVHKMIGGNFRMDALQAAVLRVKLPHLADWTSGRRRNAAFYSRLFREAGLATAPGKTGFSVADPVLLPAAVYESETGSSAGAAQSPLYFHIYNQYVIRVRERDRLRNFLSEQGIGTEIYYPIPFHRQECFADLIGAGKAACMFPVSDAAAEASIALPIFAELSEEQIGYVVKKIEEFIKSMR